MTDQFQRNRVVIGDKAQESLFHKKVIVFGVGGVGAALIETLARMGIENITIVDYDVVDITNINRQIIAFHDTIGMKKVDVSESNLKRINPNIKVKKIYEKLSLDNIEDFNLKDYDYIADCIDTISAKIALCEYAYKNNINIISSMGAGNRLNPTDVSITDIYKTSYCPLARVMRRELKKRGVKKLKVVSSKEVVKVKSMQKENIRKSVPGSVSFMPPVFGLMMALEIIKDMI